MQNRKNISKSDFKTSYDGSIFSNARTVTDSINIISSSKSDITLSELIQVLELIECIGLSKTFYYDASIPKKYRDKLLESVEFLGKNTDLNSERIKPYNAGKDKKKLLSKRAFENAIDSILEFTEDSNLLESTSLATSGGFNEDQINTFDSILNERKEIQNAELIDELVDDIQNRNNVTGRRFILNLCQNEYDEKFKRYYDYVVLLTDDEKSSFYSKSINTFRSHLLNIYAEDAESAYQPTDYSKWAISELYAKQAWRKVSSSINKNSNIQNLLNQKNADNGFLGNPTIPPFAISVLYNSSNVKNGLDLINFAVAESKRRSFLSYRKKLWDASFDDDEYQSFIDLVEEAEEDFQRYFDKSQNERRSSKLIFGIDLPKIQLPDFIAGLGGAALALYLSAPLTLGIEMLAFKLGQNIYNSTGKRGFLSFYRDQRTLLNGLNENVFISKVERVFDKSLKV